MTTLNSANLALKPDMTRAPWLDAIANHGIQQTRLVGIDERQQ